jgi:hypothetical protein
MNRTAFAARWLALLVTLVAATRAAEAHAQEAGRLHFCCTAANDLYSILAAGDRPPRRYDSPEEAIAAAESGAAVLILADDYPARRTKVVAAVLAKAAEKRLRLYIEYPEALPGVELGEPRGVRWERGVIASASIPLGLEPLHLLTLHDCQFLPAKATEPALVLARVAGFDRAEYGLPPKQHPLLFKTDEGVIVATTKLSDFIRARYAPTADWLILWRHLLDELDPAGAPHALDAAPAVATAYAKDGPLPADVERRSLGRLAAWYKKSRLLLTAEREPQIHELLSTGQETTPPPADAESGDGSHGILEGYASQILPDGSQLQRTPIRADCQAEPAAVLALDAAINGDDESREIATNLLDYLYFTSELHQRERGDPQHPAFGLIAWGAVSPAWQVGNYGDDNARTLLATMAAAAVLETDKWDQSMLKALWASMRTTGKHGFRGDRIDIPELERVGWRALGDAEKINYSPFFEAYSWACFLWAYDKTGEPQFLDKTKTAIRMTMNEYPHGWRWADNLDRTHMLLALAWLVRVDDTPEHREWLLRVARDLIEHQDPTGAIPERLTHSKTGHYVVPPTNEAYGTSETPLIHHQGDPVTDQLYTTAFILLGLREAVAVTGDDKLSEAEDNLAQYVVRIQTKSDVLPYLDGTWFRAFDYHRWDYWSSSGDMGWGAWAVETGWGPAWTGIVLGLRERNTSLWDLTAGSRIKAQLDEVKREMAKNDGGPWTP